MLESRVATLQNVLTHVPAEWFSGTWREETQHLLRRVLRELDVMKQYQGVEVCGRYRSEIIELCRVVDESMLEMVRQKRANDS